MKPRLVFLAFLLISLMSLPVHAQGEQPAIPAAPANGDYVLDELGWMSDTQKSTVNAIINRLDQEGVAQIAVVTLDDCGSDKNAFRKQLFDTWGIGHSDDNDGLLILVCWYGGDKSRRSVEQLYGRGLNRILSSSKTDEIARQDFIPAFQQGKPGDGLVAMVRDYNVKLRTSHSFIDSVRKAAAPLEALLCLFGSFIFLMVINRLFPGVLSPGSKSGQYYDRDFHTGDSDGGGGYGGGSSDGGGGSSTGF
jgi:uncharacterized protein